MSPLQQPPPTAGLGNTMNSTTRPGASIRQSPARFTSRIVSSTRGERHDSENGLAQRVSAGNAPSMTTAAARAAKHAPATARTPPDDGRPTSFGRISFRGAIAPGDDGHHDDHHARRPAGARPPKTSGTGERAPALAAERAGVIRPGRRDAMTRPRPSPRAGPSTRGLHEAGFLRAPSRRRLLDRSDRQVRWRPRSVNRTASPGFTDSRIFGEAVRKPIVIAGM